MKRSVFASTAKAFIKSAANSYPDNAHHATDPIQIHGHKLDLVVGNPLE